MRNNSGIYIIRNNIDKRIYIGSAFNIRKRFNVHNSLLRRNKHHSKKLQNFYNKYGKNSLIFEVLEYCNKKVLLKKEQYYIDKYDPIKNGFNNSKNAGNIAGFKMTKKSRMKISAALKGKPRSLEHRKALSLAHKGGVKLAARGLKRTKKQCENISLGQLNSNKARKAKLLLRKKVKQLDLNNKLIKIWKSITHVALKLNIDASNIVKVLKGKKYTAYKFKWEYA